MKNIIKGAIKNKLFTPWAWFFLFLIFSISFFTYFFLYTEPSRGFWDENYYIVDAQKYLNGVYFMSVHPPLGKLLMALGEKMFFPNGQQGKDGFYDSKFINSDKAPNFPDDFSFLGYRFFSALLGWLAAPLLFLIFLYVTRNSLFSFFLSFLYVFDNALLVHIRGAMLEGPLIFFTVLMLLIYFLLLEYDSKKPGFVFILLVLFFGMSFGLIVATKVFGLAMILLLPAYLYRLLPNWKKIILASALFLLGFLVVYVAVWQIHFALGKEIKPALSNNGYYEASSQYKKIISEGGGGNIFNFPVMLRDSINYVSIFNKKMGQLNLSNPNENASPFFLWPLGARAIRYRWDEMPGGAAYKYLYLQSNPVVWLSAFFALLIGCSLLCASWFFKLPLKNRELLAVFIGIYLSYMIAFSFITRVLYLYSYFIPLILSFIILGLVFMELNRFGRWKLTKRSKTIILFVFACLIFISFIFYSPLTYHQPISDKQFNMRNILPIWGLTCVKCASVNMLGIPVKGK